MEFMEEGGQECRGHVVGDNVAGRVRSLGDHWEGVDDPT